MAVSVAASSAVKLTDSLKAKSLAGARGGRETQSDVGCGQAKAAAIQFSIS